MFGIKLKEYRNSLNLTQEEFAKKSNISRGIISQIESDVRPPSKSVLIKLSDFSGKSIDWWYNKDDAREYGDLNALDVLLDYMIDKDMVKQNGDMDNKSKEYIWKLIEATIKNKQNKKV